MLQTTSYKQTALHEWLLTEDLHPSLMPEPPQLRPQHTLVFASGNAHKSREQWVSTQINWSLASACSIKLVTTCLSPCLVLQLHNPGPWWGAVGSSGHRAERKLLRWAGPVKQLMPSESSLQLLKRIEEPGLSHTNCPSSFLRPTGFPFTAEYFVLS